MFLKRRINLILSLCLIALTSVGFSSWVITINSATVTGTIETDYVINSQEYVYLDKSKGDDSSGINTLKYSKHGFLNDDGTLTNTGVITNYFVVDVKKCNELFTNCTALEVSFRLSFINFVNPSFNIFENETTADGVKSFSSELVLDSTRGDYYASSNIHTESANINSTREYTITATFNNLLSNSNIQSYIYFEIDYEFFANMGAYFVKNFYPNVHENDDNQMYFTLNVSVMGVK